MDFWNSVVDYFMGLPQPPPELGITLGGAFVILVMFVYLLLRRRVLVRLYWRIMRPRPKNKLFTLEGTKVDIDAKERQLMADLICDAFEEAEVQGILRRKTKVRYYRKIGKRTGLSDLIPRTTIVRKLHPYKLKLLKEEIKARLRGGPANVVSSLKRLSEVEAEAKARTAPASAKRRLRAVS